MQDVSPDTLIDGRYLVEDRIGSGGMADVYRATDQQLGRKVALKLLYRRFAMDQEFVERFRREASAAAGLQHPNVVSVFDRGEWNGTYYIAMEYLTGRSLKEVVREQGALDPDYAVEVTIQILKAARFAHKRGIIHRDIKPHNVILDEEGRAKVTDFGIARAGASDMTETGSIMGTAQYLSPEQAQGLAVSAQSDLYSIGIVLYELLTGSVPFDADSAVTIALKQVSEEPVPPTELNPNISRELEDIVLCALAKDPAYRYADADEFIAALEAIQDGSAAPVNGRRHTGSQRIVVPQPPDPDYRPPRRWPWIVLGLALLLIAGGALALALKPKKVSVPTVVNLRADSAAARIANAELTSDQQQVTSEDVPEGRVMRQDPQPGTKVKKNSVVHLIVSSGPGNTQVPIVVGSSRDDAISSLKKAGLKVTEKRARSSSVPVDRVISVSPEAGQTVQKNTVVQIVVSAGPVSIEVPALTGKSLDDAEQILIDLGLKLGTTQQKESDQAVNTVLEQNPAAQTKVAKGDTVTLTVAKAPAKQGVPNVVGLSTDKARAALAKLGFSVDVRSKKTKNLDEDGNVISQSPNEGQERSKGATVVIFVGKFDDSDLNPEGSATPTPTATPKGSPTPTATPTATATP